MSDWLEKLEQDVRRKSVNDRAESELRSSQEAFINDHAFDSWRELAAKVASACERLSSRSILALAFGSINYEAFTVTGGTRPLDVSFDPRTKGVNWELRGTPDRGRLAACQVNHEFVYRNDRNEPLRIEDAAAFLMHKVF